MQILARINPAVTPARAGKAAAAALILFGAFWAYRAAPRLAAEVTGGGVLAYVTVGYLRAQEALRRAAGAVRRAEAAAPEAAAEARQTAVLMVDALVAHQTADLRRRLQEAEHQATEHEAKAFAAGGRAADLEVRLTAADARCARLDATGRFMALALRWDRARRTKKAAPVVAGVTLDADYWWKEVETAAVARWGATQRNAADLRAAVEAVVEEPDVAKWRLLAASEYGLTLSQT